MLICIREKILFTLSSAFALLAIPDHMLLVVRQRILDFPFTMEMKQTLERASLEFEHQSFKRILMYRKPKQFHFWKRLLRLLVKCYLKTGQDGFLLIWKLKFRSNVALLFRYDGCPATASGQFDFKLGCGCSLDGAFFVVFGKHVSIDTILHDFKLVTAFSKK